MKMKGFAGLLLLFAQESPILRHISFRQALLPNTGQTWCSRAERWNEKRWLAMITDFLKNSEQIIKIEEFSRL
jgi:hypothetical protein